MPSMSPMVERCGGVMYRPPPSSPSPSAQVYPIRQPSLVAFAFTILVRGGIITGTGRRHVDPGRGHVVDTGVDTGVVDRRCKQLS